MHFLTRYFLVTALLCGVAVNLSIAQPIQLSDLLRAADTKNPSLKVSQEQIAIAASKIDQVTSLPDPVLSISLLNYPVDEFKTSLSPMTGNEIRLAQKFPFPGKLDAKGRIAAQKSHWFASVYQDSRLQIWKQVKDAWYQLLFQRQAIELTQRNLQILDDFIRLTETRYEVGKGLQQNVLKAHLQRSKQLDKLLGLQQQEAATQATLNSLAGRSTDAVLDIDATLEAAAKTFNLRDLQQSAEQNRPMFAAFMALIDQYKAQQELARLDYKPDFTLWAGYRWRDDGLVDGGTDFVSAGVSFNLPVRKARRAAAVVEANSSLRLAYQKRDDFREQTYLAIHRSLSRFEQTSKLVELYRGGIIPQATQTFQATMSAYQVDKVDFLSLLDAAMSLYRYEIDYARTLSDQQRSRAQIEAAAGLDIDQLQTPLKSAEG
ncbi:MAG: TolC family protein [Desulfuromusa sp.]